MMMDDKESPIDILINATKKISPTLIYYEIGSNFELFTYDLIEKSFSHFENVIVISFYDAFNLIYQYWKLNINNEKLNKIIEKIKVISVNSIVENELLNSYVVSLTTPTTLLNEIARLADEANGKKTLILILGMDIYTIYQNEETFAKLYSLLIIPTSKYENMKIISAINPKIFSQKTTELISSYSFNVAYLGIEALKKEFARYLKFLRIAFLEYTLKKWIYQIIGVNLVFTEAVP